MYAGKGYGGRLSRDWEAASRGRSLLLRIWSFPSAPPRRSGDVRAETSLHQVDNLRKKQNAVGSTTLWSSPPHRLGGHLADVFVGQRGKCTVYGAVNHYTEDPTEDPTPLSAYDTDDATDSIPAHLHWRTSENSISRDCLVDPNWLNRGVPRVSNRGLEEPLSPLCATKSTRFGPLPSYTPNGFPTLLGEQADYAANGRFATAKQPQNSPFGSVPPSPLIYTGHSGPSVCPYLHSVVERMSESCGADRGA